MNSLADNNKNPFIIFKEWYKKRLEQNISEPTAMILATATKEGKPSSRVVLLKSFSEAGFVFFTNYQSRKGKELSDNPFAALTFYWQELYLQIRVEGSVEKTSRAESETYFNSRARGSQLGAWSSPQSNPIENRKILEDALEKITEKYADKEIPCPPNWGGFRLKPYRIEFWEGKEHRLHHRTLFEFKEEKWSKSLLAP